MDVMLLLTLREEHGFRVLHTYIHTLHSMDPELVNMMWNKSQLQKHIYITTEEFHKYIYNFRIHVQYK
jgi:hypothetical protein